MSRRSLAAALLTLLAAALLPGAPSLARSTAPLPADFFGVYSFQEPSPAEFNHMKSAGVDTLRVLLYWRDIEPNPPSVVLGQNFRTYDWSMVDEYFKRAASAGIRIHPSLYGTPSWVSDGGPISADPLRHDGGRNGWKDFVAAALKRYGPAGDFWDENPTLPKMPPVVWQIWNEQNTSARFSPSANPEDYGELLKISGREIRAADPGARILTGGMFGTPQTPRSYTAWAFLRKLYEVPGVREYIDAVAVHPYSPDLRGIRYQIRKIRNVMRDEGAADDPLEITELGWSSATGDGFFFYQGRRGQARMLRKSFAMLLRNREKWHLERLIWLSWRDIAQGPTQCGYCQKMGLLREDKTPKPAFNQYVRFANAG